MLKVKMQKWDKKRQKKEQKIKQMNRVCMVNYWCHMLQDVQMPEWAHCWWEVEELEGKCEGEIDAIEAEELVDSKMLCTISFDLTI